MNAINRDWLKLVAGEARGLVRVHLKVRHPDTKVTLFNEGLALHAGDKEVTVLDSDNPDSVVVGVTLAIADVRNEVTGPLGQSERFLRKLLRLRFKAEIEHYFEILKDLETINLLEPTPEHFQAENQGDGFYRLHTAQGALVVGRQTERENAAVSFTLIRAAKEHPLASRQDVGSIVVYYINGRPACYDSKSPQALLAAELAHFDKSPVSTY